MMVNAITGMITIDADNPERDDIGNVHRGPLLFPIPIEVS